MSRSIKTPVSTTRTRVVEDFVATTLPLSHALTDPDPADPVMQQNHRTGIVHRPHSQRAVRMALHSAETLRHQFTQFHKSIPRVSAFVTSIRPESGLLRNDDEDDEVVPTITTTAAFTKPPRCFGMDKESWTRVRSGVTRSTFVAPVYDVSTEYTLFRKEVNGGTLIVHTPSENVMSVVIDTRPASRGLKNVERDLEPDIPDGYVAPGTKPVNPYCVAHSPYHPDPSLVFTPSGIDELLASAATYEGKVCQPTYFVRKSQQKSIGADLIPPTDHTIAQERSRQNAIMRNAFQKTDATTRLAHTPLLRRLQNQVASKRTPTMLVQTALQETKRIKGELFRMKLQRAEFRMSTCSASPDSFGANPLGGADKSPRGTTGVQEITSQLVSQNRQGIIKRQFFVPNV